MASAMLPAIVFDLDGTLVDTAPDLCFAINTVLAEYGRESIPVADMPKLIGNGSRMLVQRAFMRTGKPIGDEGVDMALKAFLTVYAEHQADRSVVYPGVIETLEALKAEGVPMAVLTNKPHEAAARMMADFNLGRFFSKVWGGGILPWLKPEGRLFLALRKEMGDGGPAVMVGDSRPDAETARNAGAPSILVSYGYSTEPVGELGADVVIDRFSDVPDAVRKALANQAVG